MPEESEDTQDEDLEIENYDKESYQEDEAVVEYYDTVSYPSDFTLDNLYSQWKNGNIIIPDFQREYVWTIKQASLLIDSFMMGLPVPPVFWYFVEDNKYLVMDGQQRLLSIFFFFEGFFGHDSHGRRRVFKLVGLGGRRYADKRYEEFSEQDKRKLNSYVLRAINIRQIGPSQQNTSVYHIFARLNMGGTPLKPQEIRNCVFSGKFIEILRDLNKDANWRKILGKAQGDKHQKDTELLLRLFAFLERGYDQYAEPMKEFLNKAMLRNRSGNTDFVKEFTVKFPVTCRRIVKRLGEKPFHVRGPINSAYLDSVFCTIYSNMDRLPDCLDDNFNFLKVDEGFNRQYTGFGAHHVAVVRDRFEYVKKILLDSPT